MLHPAGLLCAAVNEGYLERDLVEVAIQGAQHCLVRYNAHALPLPLNLYNDWF